VNERNDSNMEKKWWESKAVVGGLITVCAAAVGAFGIVIDADTQDQIAEFVVVVATAIGGLLAIYGRVKADSKIK